MSNFILKKPGFLQMDNYNMMDCGSPFVHSMNILKAGREGRFIIPMQTLGKKIPFFAIPGFFFYRKLALALDKDQPFYVFEPSPYKTLEEKASHYISEIRKVRPRGPYLIGAYCNHSILALEIAQQLLRQEENIPMLIFFESYSPESSSSKFSFKYVQQRFGLFLNQFNKASTLEKLTLIKNEVLRGLRKIYAKIRTTPEGNYTLQAYSGNVTLFKASVSAVGTNDREMMGWSKYLTGEVEVYVIDGDHSSIFEEPGVARLSENLKKITDRLQ